MNVRQYWRALSGHWLEKRCNCSPFTIHRVQSTSIKVNPGVAKPGAVSQSSEAVLPACASSGRIWAQTCSLALTVDILGWLPFPESSTAPLRQTELHAHTCTQTNTGAHMHTHLHGTHTSSNTYSQTHSCMVAPTQTSDDVIPILTDLFDAATKQVNTNLSDRLLCYKNNR